MIGGSEFPMLHTKFHGSRSNGSVVAVQRGLKVCGHGGHIGNVPHLICKTFHNLAPISVQMKFGFK